MTLQEANDLLDSTKPSDKPSRINPSITEAQAIDIVRRAINAGPRALQSDGIALDEILEKRVHQVTRNQRRPRY